MNAIHRPWLQVAQPATGPARPGPMGAAVNSANRAFGARRVGAVEVLVNAHEFQFRNQRK